MIMHITPLGKTVRILQDIFACSVLSSTRYSGTAAYRQSSASGFSALQRQAEVQELPRIHEHECESFPQGHAVAKDIASGYSSRWDVVRGETRT